MARPSRTPSGGGSPSVTISEAEMLGRVEDPAYRAAIASLLEALPSIGCKAEFVSAGCSIRVKTPLRSDPISLGWFYPPSSSVGFLGSRDLTLGYDMTNETRFPEAIPILRRFVERASALPGAHPLEYRSRLIHFAPQFVKQSLIDEIKELLASTHEALQALE